MQYISTTEQQKNWISLLQHKHLSCFTRQLLKRQRWRHFLSRAALVDILATLRSSPRFLMSVLEQTRKQITGHITTLPASIIPTWWLINSITRAPPCGTKPLMHGNKHPMWMENLRPEASGHHLCDYGGDWAWVISEGERKQNASC